MMVIAAMLLLGTMSLGVNSTLINSTTTGLQMEASLDAISYGQSLLDEILAKEFDEKTITTRAFHYTDLTSAASFGPDGASETFTLPDTMMDGKMVKDPSHGGDVYATIGRVPLSQTKYDDVDDYNNYVRVCRNPRLDNFYDSVKVEYVLESNPDNLSGSNTFYKRVTVTVWNQYMTKTSEGVVFPIVMWDISVYRRYF